MTRNLVGVLAADTVVRKIGSFYGPKSATLTLWDAQTDGNQLTTLSTDGAGTQLVSSVTSDDYGNWQVYLPDGVTSAWVDDGNPDTARVLVVAGQAVANALAGSQQNATNAAQSASDAQAAAAQAKAPTDDMVSSLVPASSNSKTSSALSTAYANKYLEGLPLWVYGHSFTPVPGFYCTKNGGEWSSRLASRLRMVQTNRGVSGMRMIEVAQRAIGGAVPATTSVAAFPAASTGVVMLQAEINDLILTTSFPTDAKYQQGFEHALRSALATFSAGSRIEATAATASGTWTTFSNGTMSNGQARYSATAGAYLEWTGVSAPTGIVYLLTLANSDASTTGSMQVDVDGVTQVAAYVGQGQMKNFTSSNGGGNVSFGPAVLKLTMDSSTTHTIRVTNTGAGTGTGVNVWADALLVPSVKPPLIIVAKDPRPNVPPANLGDQQRYDSGSATFHQIIDNVCAEFSNAHTVDLGPGWTAAMQAATDAAHFHPNDVGMSHLADTYQSELLSVVGSTWKDGLHNL